MSQNYYSWSKIHGDVIGLTPLNLGQYPINAIEDEHDEVAKSKATIC